MYGPTNVKFWYLHPTFNENCKQTKETGTWLFTEEYQLSRLF